MKNPVFISTVSKEEHKENNEEEKNNDFNMENLQLENLD